MCRAVSDWGTRCIKKRTSEWRIERCHIVQLTTFRDFMMAHFSIQLFNAVTYTCLFTYRHKLSLMLIHPSVLWQHLRWSDVDPMHKNIKYGKMQRRYPEAECCLPIHSLYVDRRWSLGKIVGYVPNLWINFSVAGFNFQYQIKVNLNSLSPSESRLISCSS
jgi:hypothetical protein